MPTGTYLMRLCIGGGTRGQGGGTIAPTTQTRGALPHKVQAIVHLEVLKNVHMSKDMIDTLVYIFFTIPVTTFTAESNFFNLRHLKTYLRSSMTEEHLIILNAYKEDTDQFNLQEIVTAFISMNSRRKLFILAYCKFIFILLIITIRIRHQWSH